jgi:hypothetical protein
VVGGNWKRFEGLGPLHTTGYVGRSFTLNLTRWIEHAAHLARLDRVEVAHLRIKTRRASGGQPQPKETNE